MAGRLPERGFIPGLAMELTCNDPDDGMPWDFNDEGNRTKAMKHVKRDEAAVRGRQPHVPNIVGVASIEQSQAPQQFGTHGKDKD